MRHVWLWMIVLAATGTALGQSDSKGKILIQKEELEQIRKDLEAGQQRLDSLKTDELAVQKQISNYDQRIASDRTVIGRLNRELGKLRQSIEAAESELQDNRLHYGLSQERYLSNLRRFYLAAHQPVGIVPAGPNESLELNRRITYLNAVVDFDAGNVKAASNLLQQSQDEMASLHGEQDKVTGLKKKKETAVALESSKKKRKERTLEQLRREKAEEADRVVMLQQAAEEMERIVARLEEELGRRGGIAGQGDEGPSAFEALKGQLTAPCRGKIVTTFGPSVDPVTKLRSFSPGIVIDGASSRNVVAAAAGRVAYIGSLRGYGDFVIINHDDRYFSTYAGIRDLVVGKGQYVFSGAKLGVADTDGRVRFELRRGREPVDPVEWIRIDAF